MKIETINVSLKKDLELFSYPIFVGNNLLTKPNNLLNKYIKNKKIIIIHDSFFSSKLVLDKTFKDFVKSIKEITLSINLIAIPGGDQTKNMIELTNIIEKTLSYEIDRECLIIAFSPDSIALLTIILIFSFSIFLK